MLEILLGIGSIESNRPLTVAEFKRRTEQETGIPSSACTIYRLRRIPRNGSLIQNAKVCAVVPSQATRLNVGVLNALSQSPHTNVKGSESIQTSKAENVSSSLSLMHRREQEEHSGDTFITAKGMSLEDGLQKCVLARDLLLFVTHFV